ncbi:MAG TPA: ATPase, T2SS/T4P/T4SS family [Candidatus Saccharimonadales bacterium]|nr:ATPase, T2SS/T4P/T4SS family [Candidatus Saccharimonadales bacterium]
MAVTNDVIKRISKITGKPTFKTRAYLKAATDAVGQALSEGDKVTLEALGEFKLLRLPERQVKTNFAGKNQTIKLAATLTPDFELASALKGQLKTAAPTAAQSAGDSPDFRLGNLSTRGSDVQFIELTGKTIPKNLLSLVPEAIARKYQIVPFLLEGKTLSVAMTDPENEEAFNAIRKSSGKIIKPFLTTESEISPILDQYSSLTNELKDLVKSGDQEDETAAKTKKTEEDDNLTAGSPAAKIVSSLLKRSVREGASDIHIEPGDDEVVVRFRIDGVLRKILTLPKDVQPALTSRVKILANLKIDENRLPQDGRIQILLDAEKIDFRISTIPTVSGEKIVARVLAHAKGVMSFEDQGLRGRNLQVLEDNTKKAHGMTLVTGPTGSGKSTTLYAIINKIKSDGINIITMEDPVEYRMPGINQSQVNAKIGFTFATGLRSILRQDPDVVMVGEIRDRETADIAINAALTGHIVISSLHTNDSAGAIPRLLDMGIEPFLITSSTNAVIAQRLCRKICDQCRIETEVDPSVIATIKSDLEALPTADKQQAAKKNKFYKGQGCANCGNTGYKGRIGIFEIMAVDDKIKELTLKRATAGDLMNQARAEGMTTMRQDGILKALDGITTIEEVWRVTKE